MSSRNSDMKEHAFKNIKIAAVVLPSFMTKIWEFVIKLSPPPIPIKTFREYHRAKDWLLKQIVKDREEK